MQKTYTYEPKGYRIRIVWTGYFMIALFVGLIVLYLLEPTKYLYLFGILAAGYGALNTFVLKSNPRQVVIDDKTIAFVSFGQAKYQVDKLTGFQVREFANAQFYIRVQEQGGKRGRYWVHYYHFEDRDEMINEIYHIEKRIHPDNIKFRGREDMFNTRPCHAPKPVEEAAEIDPFFKQ